MEQQLAHWFELVLTLLSGLVVRAAILALVVVAISLPIVAALYGWQALRLAIDRAMGLRRIGHLRWRDGCYYTPGHLWLRPNGGGEDALRVGIDDLAQRVMPDIQSIALPIAGWHVAKGDWLGDIACSDSTVTLHAPVAGTVTAINERVLATPSLVHSDPYRRAWLVDLRPDDLSFASLPIDSGASRWLVDEEHRLTDFIEHELGIAAADGGELLVPAHEALAPAQWSALRRSFLEARV